MKDVRRQVIEALKGFSPKIIQEKIPNQADSFFYEGTIAEIRKPNGTILRLIATGDIRVNIGKKQYRNNQINDAINDWNLDDKKIFELEENGNLNWEDNNWFEVVWQKAGNDYEDCDTCVVAGDYDEAIELLKSYYEDDKY